MDDLLNEFLAETAENLQAVEPILVHWERNPEDRAALNAIFRLVHTIKGTCGFVGLPRLERIAHAAETPLGRVRDGALAMSPALVTEVLAAVDAIKRILAALAASGAEPVGSDDALVARLGTIAEGVTPAPAAAPDDDQGDRRFESRDRGPSTIRVSVDLLEQMMTSVSELVLTRNEMMQLARAHQGDVYAGVMQRISAQVSSLQEQVMRTRMQPVANAWSALPRMVRGLCAELGKQIDLDLVGGDTELDRQVLELVKDPLAHMVRNAADHGIERPEERQAAGKRSAGRIRVIAFQEGGHIIIELSDDGRGIDTERLRRKAVDMGILSAADAETMTRAQMERLIFHPGLTTAKTVTSISGRGVGMDIVKANIERIGGTIHVESSSGNGTVFTLRIPLTLAIMPVLIVGVGSGRFALPQMSVVEIVDVGPDSDHVVEQLQGASVLRLRGRLLPLIDLGACLGLDAATDARFLVVVRAGTATYGIIVSELFDTEEVVVKPVASLIADIDIYAGNAILGDGHVIMILDSNGMAAHWVDAAFERAAPEDAGDQAAAQGERDAMLLFKAAGHEALAVPLSLVARIEDFPAARIEHARDATIVQYRGDLLRLVTVDGAAIEPGRARYPVLVFTDGTSSVGLVIDEICDVIEDVVDLHMADASDSRLATAVVGGRVAEVLDVAHYLNRAGGRRPGVHAARSSQAGASILVIDDSAFFRNMLRPLLQAAGHDVVTAATAEEALALRERGERFDLILSDIEMPGLSGLEFARMVRADSSGWASVPLVALSSVSSQQAAAQGLAAGFDAYIAKFDRSQLLRALDEQMQRKVA